MRQGTVGGSGAAERAFGTLGRFLVRHPWYPILFWIALLLVTAPFLARVNTVTNNSATALPSSSPSAEAALKIGTLFPGQVSGSVSLLLVVGPNLTGPTGRASVLALADAVAGDPNVKDLGGVSTLYSEYGTFLAGQGQLGLAVLGPGFPGPSGAWAAINGTASLLWGPPSLFVSTWLAYGAAHPSTSPPTWNAPAYNATRSQLGGDPAATSVLDAFYNGRPGIGDGFNGSADCAASAANVSACADVTARATVAPLLPALLPPSGVPAGQIALAELGVANASNGSARATTSVHLLALESGLPPALLDSLRSAFPALAASPMALASWADGIARSSDPAVYPVPIPAAISNAYLAAGGTAELVVISFTVGSGTTDSSGANPVYGDVAEINRLVPATLAETDPSGTLQVFQTGSAPLDDAENQVLASSLAVVLPLTVLVLVGITIVYFRAPLAPLLTFGGLAIALALGVGAVVLIGTYVTHVDVTALELQNTFVLGVGTDYSIFLVARFREELYRGASPEQAVVQSVTWAGQSVATSGATAILATGALAFSGVTLLSQWGMVLSVAVLLTVLISLTVVPAALVLLGRRTFWPQTGARFDRQAAEIAERTRTERTYFFRAGRRTQSRARPVLALVLIASVPLIWVALNVPVAYDFYGQLPNTTPASQGLQKLGATFGPGYGFPIQALVTFSAPLDPGGVLNLTEIADLGAVTAQFAGLPGVASVASPVGPLGANLSTWLNLSTLPVGPQTTLHGVLAGYLGVDGRSVLLTVVPSSSGLSYEAVALLDVMQSHFATLQAEHPALAAIYFGGGAPITHDLQQQTAAATDRLIVVVSIGLVFVLLAVLRSWIIPLLAVATIGVSLGWSWAITDLVLQRAFGDPLFFFVPTVLFILILGLGIDYNIFLLTRVREERLKRGGTGEAVVQAVAATGGIITAAAVILASAFAILTVGDFLLLRAIGFSVAVAVLLDAMVVRTYFVPAALHLLGERVWRLRPASRRP